MQITIKLLDLAEARRYLSGLRSLIDEAEKSDDPQVIVLALRVLQKAAPATIRRLLEKIA